MPRGQAALGWELDPDADKWQVHGDGHASMFNSKTKRLPGHKAWMPDELGPGRYVGHEAYSHSQLVGPFLSKQERFYQPAHWAHGETEDTVTKRGPGLYVGHEGWEDKVRSGVAPFGVNVERMHQPKTRSTKMYEKLGPGTYLGHEEYKVPNSPVGFGSSSGRFAPPPRSVGETPEKKAALGPGRYRGHEDWVARTSPVGFGEATERFKQAKEMSSKMYPDMGPGRYIGHSTYDHPQNKEAFHSSTRRFKEILPPTSEHLGPGSYLGHKRYA